MNRPTTPTANAVLPPRISIGLGSWADDEYVGPLYAEGVPSNERLRAYAEKFRHVEVNATYYRSPQAAQTAGWAAQTPDGFRFDVKLHRAFSDKPRATAEEGGLVLRLLDGVKPLIEANKLGAFLLVLAPSFTPEKSRLEELDAIVAKLAPHPLAVELRHNGWVQPERREATLAYFRERNLTWVAVDMPPIQSSIIMPAVDAVTTPRLAYLRLHGRNKSWFKVKSAEERHTYEYTEAELSEIAGRVRALASDAEAVRVVANNHAQDFAPKTALGLMKLLQA